MTKILKIFKPTFFAFFIFVILILSQVLFTDVSGTSGPSHEKDKIISKTHVTYGIVPTIIIDDECIGKYPVFPGVSPVITSEEGWEKWKENEYTRTVEVKWGMLVLDLSICYILATLLAKVFKLTKIHRLTLIYLTSTLCICLVIFIISLVFSKIVWGYYLHRPKIISNVNDISQVKAVIPIKTEKNTSGDRHIIVNTDYSITKYLSEQRDSYYCLERRILIFLKDKNMLPDNLSMDLTGLTGLHSLIAQTGTLIKPDEGYDDSDLLRGIVVDALDEKGKRLVIIGVKGMEVSNDHFPYYELAFEGKHREDLKFISGQHFFYDMAGMEGFEWDVFFIYFSFIAVPIGLIVLTVILILWKLKRLSSES